MNFSPEPPGIFALGWNTRARYPYRRRWVGFHETDGPGTWARALAFWTDRRGYLLREIIGESQFRFLVDSTS